MTPVAYAEESAFAPFAERMTAAGLPDAVIRTFRHYYGQLLAGETGLIAEDEIHPIQALPDLSVLPTSLAEVGAAALPHAILLKLNGGLGTGMGLEKAKSLLKVRGDLTFLDIIARQARRAQIPLVLMNSHYTRADSLSLLAGYPELRGRIPLDFVQNMVPKVQRDGLVPVCWPEDPALEWCPPGHGDIYTALVTSGMLHTLLENGYHYAFVANADNLGAVLDPLVLGYFVAQGLPFLMEVADRTLADRKGGHLALRPSDGRLLLRESAQCPDADLAAFQDIDRHRYFNTNNLWLDLRALERALAETDGVLELPMIRNAKTVDPRNPESPAVYQLETAMGAAIARFEGAGALRVPRSRFAPVKTTDDLLLVRSDAFTLTDDWQIALSPARRQSDPPVLCLDPAFYRLVDDLDARFPFGPPSLVDCERLTVHGDVRFGRAVVCRGAVEIAAPPGHPLVIQDGAVLEGNG